MKIKFKAFAQFSFLTLLLAACTANPDSAGLEYMPDMYRSPAIEPYVDYGEVRGKINDNMKMTRSALVPPKYTIPFWGTDSAEVKLMLPYWRKPSSASGMTHGLFGWDMSFDAKNVDAEYQAAAVDKNPLMLITAEQGDKLFSTAKNLYAINCQHCHGEKGDGNGPMVVSGAYSGAANLAGLAITEGQMFYSIYYGKGAMGAHNSLLNKKEIWSLVHYIKRFQNADYGKFDVSGKLKSLAVTSTDSVPTKL